MRPDPSPGTSAGTSASAVRVRVVVRGAVQGVGFRPFVFRLAETLGLSGWVSNSSQGVVLEAEGAPAGVRQLLLRLERERPPHSFIQSLEAVHLDPAGYRGFEIRPSLQEGRNTALVLPDIATCPECVREVFDPANRRHRYPFANCTRCGPRFSIITGLPYDRARTSMAAFVMCPACQGEYDDPQDRRFHAQPNACPACGPRLELWTPAGQAQAAGDTALREAARALAGGAVVAVKGLGGFHLMVAASDAAAVQRLRERKRREEKPLAVMFPGLEAVREACEVAPEEERALRAPEAPIVLLRRRAGRGGPVAAAVAPGNPYVGAMLPYTPLHHLLLAEVGRPVVATSGNLSDEPICTDELEALERLAGIADLFLVHDRPIVRHVDDSILRLVAGRELVLRRARGFAPLPVSLPALQRPVRAVGAHLKNTVAAGAGGQAFLSQHIGDLETAPALAAFRRVSSDLERLLQIQPEVVAADAHPDYLSTGQARQSGLPVLTVQHHHAHILACMAENGLEGPVLGAAWDGTGYGLDGTIWGGEFLRVSRDGFTRVGHLRPFPLPGGDQAVKEPRRSALGLLHAALGERAFALPHLATLAAFAPAELRTLRPMLENRVNAPLTTSVGRLFDAVASLAGLRQAVRFEGQAAMDLEFALDPAPAEPYPLPVCESGPLPGTAKLAPLFGAAAPSSALLLDWGPLVEAVLADLAAGVSVGTISRRFHDALAEGLAAVARRAGERRVALGGGCFQNRYLLERSVQRLRAEGFHPYWPQRVPPNDGGIALGQLVAAAFHSDSLFQPCA